MTDGAHPPVVPRLFIAVLSNLVQAAESAGEAVASQTVPVADCQLCHGNQPDYLAWKKKWRRITDGQLDWLHTTSLQAPSCCFVHDCLDIKH